jgi:branched-chain amino acid transport system ATP-binding protein
MELMQPLLNIKQLNVFYGGIHALRDVSLHVNEGEIVSVIGANGAGKSTLLKTINSVKSFKSGEILFRDKPLPKHSYQVVKSGVTLVPEGRHIFGPLSVYENLMLGAYPRNDKSGIEKSMERCLELFPILKERIKQVAGTLSGGEQQMLAISRALMSAPQMLLLDEPSLGLAPMVIDTVIDAIINLNEENNITILLVEQNAAVALEISDRAYVLETGEIKLEGAGRTLLDDPRIRESYLGVSSPAVE